MDKHNIYAQDEPCRAASLPHVHTNIRTTTQTLLEIVKNLRRIQHSGFMPFRLKCATKDGSVLSVFVQFSITKVASHVQVASHSGTAEDSVSVCYFSSAV